MTARFRTSTMLLVGALLASCATEAGFRKGMDRLIGSPKDQLVVLYGPPLYESRTEDGRRYAQFNLSWVQTGGGYYTNRPVFARGPYYYGGLRTAYGDSYVPPYAISRRCLATFYFNAANRVASYAYAGGGCVAPE
ncbi:hypothetical protein KXR53_00555 [Inquilinus limosus]|uniref:hypothetical protein n=1 Tax=Inquilinus limosus TaxID=171674 RepID=UPI003F14A9E1